VRRVRWSIRVRLTAIYASLFVVAGAALLVLNYGVVDRQFANQIIPSLLLERPDKQAAGARTDPNQGVNVQSLARDLSLSLSPAEIDQLKSAGVITNDPLGSKNPAIGVLQGPDGTNSVPTALEKKLIKAVNAKTNKVRSQTLRELVNQSGFTLAALTLLAILAGWVIAGRVLRPVKVITATARRLSNGNLNQRIPATGSNDELGELVDTFNSMLERIQSGFDTERLLIANASHELRTPLANQRTLLEVGLDDPNASADDLRITAEAVLVQTVRNERLVNRLLQLSRATHLTSENFERVDLANLVSRLAQRIELRGLSLELNVHMCPIVGDPILLELLVGNLIENAVNHNVANGHIVVGTGVEPNSAAILTISNTGPKLTDEQIATITRPFRRASGDRTNSHRGAGIGLALVDSIAKAHNGTLCVSGNVDGGLFVKVRFSGLGDSPK
jgi:signal transduction histidine kinase